MSNDFFGFVDDCTLLFFILVFLVLFWHPFDECGPC